MNSTRYFWLIGLVVSLALLLGLACDDGGDGDDDDDGQTPSATDDGGAGGDVPGVTDTEVVFGTHQPLSNTPATSYAQISRVTQAYFDYINATEGGVHGRQVRLIQEDDQYNPSLTVDAVRKLVERDGVFAILNGLGTPTHLQVVDYLRDNDVPDMFMSTGAVEWVRDPEARPNIFGAIPHYIAEGIALGMYVAENYEGQNLGIIFQNDDFGEDGMEGVERGAGDAVTIVGRESYEPVDPDLNSQVDALLSANADVIVIYALPPQTATAIRHARQDVNSDVDFIISGVSANELTIVIAGEENIAGTVSTTIFHQAYETDHPGIQAHAEILAEYAEGIQPNYLTIYGQYIGEMTVEALRLAGEDLTRESLIDAAESIQGFTCSVCLFEVNLSETDHDPAQAGILTRAEAGHPTSATDVGWVPFGELLTWEGTLADDLGPDDFQTAPSPYEQASALLR